MVYDESHHQILALEISTSVCDQDLWLLIHLTSAFDQASLNRFMLVRIIRHKFQSESSVQISDSRRSQKIQRCVL